MLGYYIGILKPNIEEFIFKLVYELCTFKNFVLISNPHTQIYIKIVDVVFIIICDAPAMSML